MDASKEGSFFLCQKKGSVTLERAYSYYYQVQAQIEQCGAKYCDFVVWSERETLIEKIHPNEEFIKNAFDRASAFIKLAVLPELMAKWYSKVSFQPSKVAATVSAIETAPSMPSTGRTSKRRKL